MGESTVGRNERDVWNEFIKAADERDRALARIAALEAKLREREEECEKLRKKLDQRDYEIASILKRQTNE